MVPSTWLVLFSTRFGLGLRAVGENPGAVDTTGISVTWLRYHAASSSAFDGHGRRVAVAPPNAGFVKDMSASKGSIVQAALIARQMETGAGEVRLSGG